MRRISQNERLGMIALAILAVSVIAAGFWTRSCASSHDSENQCPLVIKEIIVDTVIADGSTGNSHEFRRKKSGKSYSGKTDSLKSRTKRLKTTKKGFRKSSSSALPPRNFLYDTIPVKQK